MRVLGARYIALWRNTLDADERFWVTTWFGFGFGFGFKFVFVFVFVFGFGFGFGFGFWVSTGLGRTA